MVTDIESVPHTLPLFNFNVLLVSAYVTGDEEMGKWIQVWQK